MIELTVVAGICPTDSWRIAASLTRGFKLICADSIRHVVISSGEGTDGVSTHCLKVKSESNHTVKMRDEYNREVDFEGLCRDNTSRGKSNFPCLFPIAVISSDIHKYSHDIPGCQTIPISIGFACLELCLYCTTQESGSSGLLWEILPQLTDVVGDLPDGGGAGPSTGGSDAAGVAGVADVADIG